jgi:hypothetical protein
MSIRRTASESRASPAPRVRTAIDDSGFLRALRWRKGASPALVEAAGTGDLSAFQRAWRKLRPAPARRWKKSWTTPLRQAAWLFDGESSSSLDLLTRETLLACDDAAGAERTTNHLAALLDATEGTPATSPRHVAAWLTLIVDVPAGPSDVVDVRLWCEALRECREMLGNDAGALSPGLSEALQAELLFRAGLIFAEVRGAASWRRAGREGWRQLLSQAVDADGVPRGDQLPELTGWLVSLTRTWSDARRFGIKLWTDDDEDRLLKLARRAAALCLPDGTLPGDDADGETTLDVLTTFARLAGWKKKSEPLGCLLRLRANLERRSRGERNGHVGTSRPLGVKRRVRVERYAKHSAPGCQSDESRVAILRNHWGVDANTCVVAHHTSRMTLDLAVHGRRVLSGEWGFSVQRAEGAVEVAGPWSCDCWHSDKDGDFAEFGSRVGDIKVARQLFLSRRDNFLVVADALRDEGEGEFATRLSLPLVGGVTVESDGYSREAQVRLRNGGGRLRVLPVSLPWERVLSDGGRFDAEPDELTLDVRGRQRLCQVLVLDWSRERRRRPADWGTASVVEEGRPLSRLDALAARWRVGNDQWLYFHNLTRCRVARTALGHHTTSETVIGRFKRSGHVEPLVHVDAGGESDAETTEDSGSKSAGFSHGAASM